MGTIGGGALDIRLGRKKCTYIHGKEKMHGEESEKPIQHSTVTPELLEVSNTPAW